MKKYIVLGVLFILPIVVYLFFASGVNNFGKLPVLTENVDAGSSLGTSLDDKITVLGFLGGDIDARKLNAFNLNQKIYKRFNGFEDFQFVMVVPRGTETAVEELKKELSKLADVSNWKFVFAPENDIITLFTNLNTPFSLDEKLYSPYVFIVDKKGDLRGRLKDDDTKRELFGYDATSVAVLNNKMIDDMKVLLAEYRLAVKDNGVTRRDSYLKYNTEKDEE
ncbi:hypothetical protein HX109_07760 [Galbibacter sp. BG1]|uniref:hypothetical protein n=1 Tax=Galbibacter sp. BG1 TaxID=1170699 RepID=UPI0015BF9978|nr:hypothetical protein [Galbibacter sp. BG1]QLE01466.1 hypothetical protein HX109_07760 [Galbibacter sp. BG1]